MLSIRKSLRVLTPLTPLLIGACATEPLPNRFDEAALIEGRITLECESPRCAFAWQTRRKAIDERYESGDWHALARLVGSVDFPSDLAYFYLGRAAEALDAPEAAATYFERALEAPRKCADSIFDRCTGIDVAGEAALWQARIAEVLSPPEMDLVEAQTRLSQLGLYTIRIDGVTGPHTRRAIETFQKRHGIPRSGKLDGPTRIALAKTETAAKLAATPRPDPSPPPATAPGDDRQVKATVSEETAAPTSVAERDAKTVASMNATAPMERTRVTVEVDLLSDADPFADVLEIVEQGSWVDVIDSGDEWSRVSHRDKVGYVYTEILQ